MSYLIMQTPAKPHALQRGSTLIETMVAVLVVAIGIVGMAALQAKTLRNAFSSQQRQQAVLLMHSLFESMQSTVDNRPATQTTQAALANFVLPRTCTIPTAVNTARDRWLLGVKQTLGSNRDDDGTCAAVACATQTLGAPARSVTQCTATIEWNDEGGSNDRAATARNPRITQLQSTMTF